MDVQKMLGGGLLSAYGIANTANLLYTYSTGNLSPVYL